MSIYTFDHLMYLSAKTDVEEQPSESRLALAKKLVTRTFGNENQLCSMLRNLWQTEAMYFMNPDFTLEMLWGVKIHPSIVTEFVGSAKAKQKKLPALAHDLIPRLRFVVPPQPTFSAWPKSWARWGKSTSTEPRIGDTAVFGSDSESAVCLFMDFTKAGNIKGLGVTKDNEVKECVFKMKELIDIRRSR